MPDKAAPLVLTVVDSASIQPYIFGSNNLQQIAGASGLVNWATNDAAYDALPKPHNLTPDHKPDPRYEIVRDQLAAELVYSGGGNTVVLFRNQQLAVEFTKNLTLEVLKTAPGLRLVVAHVDFDWVSDVLAAKVVEAIRAVNDKKRSAASLSTPLLGLGVTADCQYTGAPAVNERTRHGRESALQRVSAAVNAKANYFEASERRLQKKAGSAIGSYRFIRDFEQIGEPGESSYLAVVHIDGNGMGNRVKAIADRHHSPAHNRNYIDDMRAFSDSIDRAGDDALRTIAGELAGAVTTGAIGGIITVRDGRLPFRPIVFGGDDITFVCDGRLGVQLAERYLRELEAHKLYDGATEDNLFVRAGVAVVNTHYPFARAYELAEELAGSAKDLLKQHKPADAPYARLSALDWHFAVNGLTLSLDDLRERTYTWRTPGDLVMRPLLLRNYDQVDEWRTWPMFETIRNRFVDEQGPWLDKRNKVKALRDTLRRGPDAVNQFMVNFSADHHLPPVTADPNSKYTGWVKAETSGQPRCAWFDVVESLDFDVAFDKEA